MDAFRSPIQNPIDLNDNEHFGWSISLSSDGTILAIGAKGIYSTNNLTHSNVGAVFVYQFKDTGRIWML